MVKIHEDGQLYWTFEVVLVHPVVQELVSQFIPRQRETIAKSFYSVWIRHYNAWESIERKEQHSIENIKKIEWDGLENCFKVYYKKTKIFSADWYHYTLKGEWY